MKTRIRSMVKNCVPSAVVRQKLSVDNCILFTFDDGPQPAITPQVLDILDQYGAKSLFFIPGKCLADAPHLIKEIVSRGHGIGNHSWSHTTCSCLRFSEIVNEIDSCQIELTRLSGARPRFFRPPKGVVTMQSLFAAKQCGCEIMRWSLDTGEYSYLKNRGPEEMADNFFRKLHDRAIVLSHDDHQNIPEMLKMVLPQLVDRGYDLESGLSSLSWVR